MTDRLKVLCNSKECLRRFKCRRWEENYDKLLFERNEVRDLLTACDITNYTNFERKKDE